MDSGITYTSAIKNFLINRTHEDLAALYNYNMEVQVNVAQDNGERIEGDYKGRKWVGWSDGVQTWKSFRIPYNAASNPEYNDKQINFDLDKHVEAIGMTGWDWVNKVSKWVGFDFDAITGHSDRHEKKLTDIQLKEIRESVSSVPWVTVRTSTGGKGLHLYVYLNDIPTDNHNEHAALARAILGKLSAVTGFDFKSKVDVCGGNLWVWGRKLDLELGLKVIKQGTTLDEVPDNWREHIKVVSGKKRRTVPSFIEESDKEGVEDLFEELSGTKSNVPLDEGHKKLINFLEETKASWWWDSDNHMLVCHTYDLKAAYEKLNLKGVFDTISKGTEKGADWNCYAFPLRKSGWIVRRFSQGAAEVATWEQDSNGWTRCFLNVLPNLRISSKSFGGIEDSDKGGYVFREAEMAAKAAKQLGASFELPNWILSGRETKLREHKDGRLIIEIDHNPNDRADEMTGWLAKKGKWQRVFDVQTTTPIDSETGSYDDLVRHLITEANEDCGWVLKTDGEWKVEPLNHITNYLKSLNLSPKEVTQVIGSSVGKCWRIVNKPFQSEYPGNRQWNRNAPQFRFDILDKENLTYPTWMKILNHIGRNLNTALLDNPWAKSNGITNGGDYLKCWLASLFQHPTEPLPYLFLWGPQLSGKSILHESIELLVTSGIERAETAIQSANGFNKEIETAVLCVIEEVNLASNILAYNRIKDWVTSRKVSIHPKGKTPYSVTNSTHWLQCANSQDYCPVFPGDSRITMVYVGDLELGEAIPKKKLIPMLEKEAPEFLTALLKLEIPESNDRLNVPVITTEDKKSVERANRTHLEMFIEDNCFHVHGKLIKFSDFYDRFLEFLDPNYHHLWSKIKVGKELPQHKHPKGRLQGDPNLFIGNIDWEPRPPGESIMPEWICKKDKLVTKEG